jgi:hypothetical protein
LGFFKGENKMGRPLKIQKIGVGNGTTVVGNPPVTTYNQNVAVDLGYPNFNSLTNPVVNTSDTLSGTQFLGVVGGAAPTDVPTTTFPRIDVIVNIANPSGAGIGVAAGYIIRQKGSRKYLVGDATGVNDGSFVVGQAYQIVTVGDTDWTSAGAPTNYGVGTVFTASSVGGAGTGTANSVGVCVLDNDVTPAAGLMAITFTESTGDSTATPLSKLTNKFLLDFTGGSGFTQAEVANDVRFVANFFTDEGTVIKSGTTGSGNVSGQQNLLGLGIVDNVTS